MVDNGITDEHPVSGDDEMKYTFTTKENIESLMLLTDDSDCSAWEYYDGANWVNVVDDADMEIDHLNEVKFRLKANQICY